MNPKTQAAFVELARAVGATEITVCGVDHQAEAKKLVVLCCGSRSWSNWLKTKRVLNLMKQLLGSYTVLHGGARGADTISSTVAQFLGLEVDVIYPDWFKHGKRAGMLRNTEMLERRPDYVVAFWDGASRGTFDTISKAVNIYRIPTMVITI